MARFKTKVVEVIGSYKQFETDLNRAIDGLKRDKIININVTTCESDKGSRYVGVIYFRNDDSWL